MQLILKENTMKYNAIQTSELVVMENGLKFEIKRIFYLCKKRKNLRNCNKIWGYS